MVLFLGHPIEKMRIHVLSSSSLQTNILYSNNHRVQREVRLYKPIVGVVDVQSALQKNRKNVDKLEMQLRRSFGRVNRRVVQHQFVQSVAVLRRVEI